MKFCAAIDLGASSGRVAVGSLDQNSNNLESLVIKEVHRFKIDVSNDSERGLRWNWSKIVEEITVGLHKAQELGEIISIGVDTWAVDYGLIDSHGELIEDPYCYRDGRTDGLMQSIA
jgi:rhamnulokinase